MKNKQPLSGWKKRLRIYQGGIGISSDYDPYAEVYIESSEELNIFLEELLGLAQELRWEIRTTGRNKVNA